MPRSAFRTTQWIIKLKKVIFDEKRYITLLQPVRVLFQCDSPAAKSMGGHLKLGGKLCLCCL
jgi:hypothetical protein